MKRFSCVVALFALIVGATSAGAAGPTKLKQPKTFPITITKSGSYILVSNLTVPDANTTAISAQADNVTIDLNGFSILGPCTGGPPCSPTGSGNGIDASAANNENTVIQNGTIRGMGNTGIVLVDGRVERMNLLSNGQRGVDTVPGCGGPLCGGVSVINSWASANNGWGIVLGNFGVVTACRATVNGGYGIFVAGGGVVTDSAAEGNGFSPGIAALGIAGHNDCNGSPCP